MKNCRRCNIEKPLTDYYKHAQMGDGHLNICIDCTKARINERFNKKIQDPSFKESEKHRSREKYHRLYAGTITVDPEYKKKTTAKYNERYPEKAKAQLLSQHVKPLIKGNQMHHWSYNIEHAKSVIEMSPMEHAKLHRYIKYDQERMMYRGLGGVLLDTREAHIAYYESLKDKP